ncbi:MAG: endonuclease domain-containing protein [Candidatus Omnitrophica bacterium]|nr:endonuclease domain-containing protein [Candidatus Omnitrophota bacterium]MBU4457208.1 endonuclease domain-containing protein [Candidatus Omnitrophota bacterium]
MRANIPLCRKLRKDQTDAERKLWLALRNRQLCRVKFRRQFSIGGHILDFYCPEHRLAIEVDGGQHYEDTNIKQDALRTKELCEYGIKMLRVNNLDVLNNIEGVCEEIVKAVTSHLNPFPSP